MKLLFLCRPCADLGQTLCGPCAHEVSYVYMRVCQTDALCFINKTGLTIRWQDLFRGEPMVSPAGFSPPCQMGQRCLLLACHLHRAHWKQVRASRAPSPLRLVRQLVFWGKFEHEFCRRGMHFFGRSKKLVAQVRRKVACHPGGFFCLNRFGIYRPI